MGTLIRRFALLLAALLVLTSAAAAAHVHAGEAAPESGCVACTLAHAPILAASAAPAPRAPEPTRERVAELPRLDPAPALCAVPPSRGPPLG